MPRPAFIHALLALPLALAALGTAACEHCTVRSSSYGDGSCDTAAAQPGGGIDLPDSAPAKHGKKGGGGAKVAGEAMYLPTGDKNTSSVSVRCNVPREVVAGQNYGYDIEVCNLTPVTLANVQVSYKLEGAKIVSSEPEYKGGGFNVGDLPPHACRVIHVSAAAQGVGSAKACLGATWTNAVCTATSVVQPSLKLALDANVKETTPCNAIVYTVTISNPGTGAATNVKVVDELPAGVTCEGKNTLTWDIGTLDPGAVKTRQFVANAGKTGNYVNRVRGTADAGLNAASNDLAVAVKAPSLRLSVQCPAKAFIGHAATFKVTVTNKGDAPAMAARVENWVPSGMSFVSASGGGTATAGRVTWNLGTLDPGASKELTLVCTTRLLGKVENRATAFADCAEPATAACTTTYEGSADIGTSIHDDDGVVAVGEVHVFHYSVRNQGQIDLTNLTVSAELEAGLELQSSSVAGEKTPNGNKVTWKLGTLGAGREIRFDIVCVGSKAGELFIRTTASSDQTKPVRKDESVNYVER